MTEKNSFQFPLEEDYSPKVFYDSETTLYTVNGISNGVLVKAPFDCEVVKVDVLEGNPVPASWIGSFWTWSEQQPSYNVSYRSADKKFSFFIWGILPNDKSKNIGASFKQGENIGRVQVDKPENFHYRFFEHDKTPLGEPSAKPVKNSEVNFGFVGEPKETNPRLIVAVVGLTLVGFIAYLARKNK